MLESEYLLMSNYSLNNLFKFKETAYPTTLGTRTLHWLLP